MYFSKTLYPHSTSLQLIEVVGEGGGGEEVKCAVDWLNSDSHSITGKERI